MPEELAFCPKNGLSVTRHILIVQNATSEGFIRYKIQGNWFDIGSQWPLLTIFVQGFVGQLLIVISVGILELGHYGWLGSSIWFVFSPFI